MIGILVFYISDYNIYSQNASSFHSNLISVLGILIGFTISTLTMLLTVNNVNIEEAKNDFLEKTFFLRKLAYLILW